mmetsp:Transcript_42733/g.114858  ORF Transcript_42733/g.114858 Transcript_42733/m.114858 type:complete len:247 (-) Transcript_42733:736-1476(-)
MANRPGSSEIASLLTYLPSEVSSMIAPSSFLTIINLSALPILLLTPTQSPSAPMYRPVHAFKEIAPSPCSMSSKDSHSPMAASLPSWPCLVTLRYPPLLTRTDTVPSGFLTSLNSLRWAAPGPSRVVVVVVVTDVVVAVAVAVVALPVGMALAAPAVAVPVAVPVSAATAAVAVLLVAALAVPAPVSAASLGAAAADSGTVVAAAVFAVAIPLAVATATARATVAVPVTAAVPVAASVLVAAPVLP